MEKIRKDISENRFEKFYLICGNNAYMRELYAQKLKAAIIPEDNEINYTEINTEKPDIAEILGIAFTTPFFADHRLIMIKNSRFFSASNDVASRLSDWPDTAVAVFVENEIDKRNKLYKFVKDNGYVCEINELSERDYLAFVKKQMTGNGILIEPDVAAYLLERIGNDMNTIVNECGKLAAYVMDKQKAEKRDIDAVCCVLLENRIFDMIEALAMEKADKSFKLYSDLLELREAPLKILKLVYRHFNILYLIKTATVDGRGNAEIAKKAGMPDFVVKKYKNQTQRYSEEELLDIIRECTEVEESFKNGNIDINIGLETIMCRILKEKNEKNPKKT